MLPLGIMFDAASAKESVSLSERGGERERERKREERVSEREDVATCDHLRRCQVRNESVYLTDREREREREGEGAGLRERWRAR